MIPRLVALGASMLKNVLAFAAVRDIEDGIRWYKMLLGREPDTKPMTGLAEWKFEGGGWLQVNENMQLAGRSSITLVETNMDERMQTLAKAGIKPKSFVNGELVSVFTITDPDGNQVVFALGKDEKHRSTT
jgi:hypothetical protein